MPPIAWKTLWGSWISPLRLMQSDSWQGNCFPVIRSLRRESRCGLHLAWENIFWLILHGHRRPGETLAGHMKEIIQSGGSMELSPEQLQELVRRVMAGYQEYAAATLYTDPDRFDEHRIEYLQTPQAQSVLEKWASENLQFSGDLEITQEQLEALAADLAAGYQSYAAANGLPDPAKMGDYFLEYLGTDDAKQ